MRMKRREGENKIEENGKAGVVVRGFTSIMEGNNLQF
jgi:hypothetical protein